MNQQNDEIYNLKDEIKNLNSKIKNLNNEIAQAEKLNKAQEAEIKKLQNDNRNLEEKYIEQVEETNKQVNKNFFITYAIVVSKH